MRTINVDVWDFGTGQCDVVRSFTFDETDPAAVINTSIQVSKLIDGLVRNDHSTDHVPYVTEVTSAKAQP